MGLESSIYRLKNKIIISLFQNKNVKFFYFNFKFLLNKIKYILFFEILIICFKIIKNYLEDQIKILKFVNFFIMFICENQIKIL